MGILLYFKELKLENIDSNEFEKMKKMFTEDVVNSFFEDVLQENNKEAIDKVNKIMETYLLDFENQMSNTVIDCGDRYVTDAFSGYMSSISNLKVLSSEEEMKYGKLLLENRDVFSIPMDDVKSIITKKNINKSDKKILDLEKIFVSIKDKSDMKDIIRMLENYLIMKYGMRQMLIKY